MTRRAAILLACLALTGCASSPTGSGIFGLWTKRGERAVEKAEARVSVAEADLLARIQRSVEEFRAAVLLAPPSRPVEVATEAATQASGHLAQLLGPITVERLAQINARASALVSDNAATRAPAEAARAVDRKADYAAAEQVGELRTKLDAAERSNREIAKTNADTAAKYLWMTFAAAAGTVLTVVATAAALAYRANAFGMADGVARGIADLRRRDPGTAGLATAALDTGLNRTEQSAIAKRVQALLALAT